MRPEVTSEEELKNRIQPVIVGADFCGYAYIRCFWEAYGVKPIMLAAFDIKSVARSRFVDYRVIDGIDKDNAIFINTVTDLGKKLIEQGKVPFLVGCGDFYARIISENKQELENYFYVPYIDFDLLDNITQKENFYKICDEIGIPYPKTVFLDCNDKDAKVDDGGFGYPLIAKPSNSAAYHYAEIPNKKKVFFIQDKEELEEVFTNLKNSSYDRSLIVQEFVPGDDTQERILSICTDKDIDPVFMIGGRVMLEDHSPTAIGNPAVIIPETTQQVLDDALKFMRHVGFHGMANFDVKYDARTGQFLFFEINTRPGRSSFFVWQAGVNFAKVQVDDCILGKKVAQLPADKPFVYTTVPLKVVKKSIEGPEKAQIIDAYKTGIAQFPLFWKRESISQKFWASITYYHQISKFRKYLWRTGGKQADVD